MRHLDEDEKMNAVLEGKLLEAFRHPYIIQFHEVACSDLPARALPRSDP